MDDGIPAGNPAAWEAAVGDMEATADAYEEAGWETYTLRPGDTTLLETAEERAHLDVVLSGPDSETVTDLVERVRFTEYEVLKAVEEGVVYVVVLMEDPDSEIVLLYPAMYSVEDAESVVENAKEAGEFVAHLRGLEREPVEFTYEDPGLFEPED